MARRGMEVVFVVERTSDEICDERTSGVIVV
jgi:hypothetical protein